MKSNVIKNTIMLYGMSIAKIVFPLLTLPYLTRVLSVESYGVVSYVKAVMQYMQLVVDFGFMLSGTKDIVNAKNDHEKLEKEVGDILLARVLLAAAAFVALLGMIAVIPLLRANIGCRCFCLIISSEVSKRCRSSRCALSLCAASQQH